MGSVALQDLLRVLEERDISLDRDDVAWAFNDAATRDATTAWVQEHLQSDTLLTKGEVGFLQTLKVDIGSDSHSASGKPLTDEDIETTITSLEASTAAIEKQCQVMEAQRRALQDIKLRRTNDETIPSLKERQQKALARERAQLEFETDELSQTITSRLQSLTKNADAATSSISSQVERILGKDDKLLDGLQKLVPKLSETSISLDDSAEVERLCSVLASLMVDETHSHLDVVFKKGLAHHSQQVNGAHGQGLTDSKAKQRDTLRSELDELGTEIESLVNIVVDHHHRKPLKQRLDSAQGETQDRNSKWSEYSVSALMYMAARLDALCDHVQHLYAHRGALRVVSEHLDHSLAVAQANVSPSKPSSVLEAKASKGLKPLRLVQAKLSETQDPALHLIRQLDIRVSDSDSTSKLAEILESALDAAAAKASHISATTDEAIVQSLLRSQAGAESDLQSLLSSVYAHSKFRTVELSDTTLRAGVEGLGQQTQSLSEVMRELDMDDILQNAMVVQSEVVRHLSG